MRRLLIVALSIAMLPGCHRDPAKERAEEEREEREHEREKREKAEREFREKAEKGPIGAADHEALYAMGALLGTRVAPYAFGPEELAKVEKGFADAARAQKLQLANPDLEEWGPKVEAMLHRRASPALEAEKDKGRKLADAEAALPGAERLPSGVVVRTVKAGTGPSPGPTDRVRVKYEGRVAGGAVFDKGQSTELPVGQVIPCLSQGLQKVKMGGSAHLVCPPATAYGDMGRPPQIPGAATLLFDVELLAVLGK